MSATVFNLVHPWLPRQLPAQLAALGDLYKDALERDGAGDRIASVGWRLYAVLSFASRLAPLPHLAELTGLTTEQLSAVLVDFADDDSSLPVAA